MFNKFNKNIVIAKSQYGLVNNMILEAYIQRIDVKNYDFKIIETKTSYKIIVSNKLGRA